MSFTGCSLGDQLQIAVYKQRVQYSCKFILHRQHFAAHIDQTASYIVLFALISEPGKCVPVGCIRAKVVHMHAAMHTHQAVELP